MRNPGISHLNHQVHTAHPVRDFGHCFPHVRLHRTNSCHAALLLCNEGLPQGQLNSRTQQVYQSGLPHAGMDVITATTQPKAYMLQDVSVDARTLAPIKMRLQTEREAQRVDYLHENDLEPRLGKYS